MSDLSISVSHRGSSYSLSLPPTTTLADFQTQLEVLTGVLPENQKLLYKGKKASTAPETSVADAGLKDGMKIQMLGSTAQELGDLKGVEDEKKRRERIMSERAKKGTVKVRSTGSSSSTNLSYRFHRIEPLAHLPNPESARAVLQRLADDPAIIHVMQTHKFAVGLLTELAPHEHPELLGLNVNAGQQIKLRIRTDRYDGFRTYREIRRVLCHELTHNVWGDHDNNFKELNSKLNREVAEYERDVSQGTHHLGGGGDTYQPSSELEAEAQSYILGGAVSSTAPLADSAEERRQRILQAAMSRLQKEEEEIEMSCGTSGPAANP